MELKVKIHGILSDPKTETQIVILRDEQQNEILPIWVGVAEGNAIRFALEGIMPPRPMTHDLYKSMLNHLGVTLQKIVISEIKNNTYYAVLHLETRTGPQTVDARPSDAIALALRLGAPVYVMDSVLQAKSGDNLDAWLEKLNPKDLGRYEA